MPTVCNLPNCGTRLFILCENSSRAKEHRFIASEIFCIPTNNCSFFDRKKMGFIAAWCVWCDSLAQLTETCWMQPPLFAVLPSSTAPSTVAKQPTQTQRQLVNDRSPLLKLKHFICKKQNKKTTQTYCLLPFIFYAFSSVNRSTGKPHIRKHLNQLFILLHLQFEKLSANTSTA